MLHEKVYHDEVMKAYADEALCKRRNEAIRIPAPGMETSVYLREEEWFRCPVPEELKDSPMYYVSDDDRLYWWDGTNEVMVSENMNQWLGTLAIRHRELLRELSEQNRQAGGVIRCAQGRWEGVSRKVRFNRGAAANEALSERHGEHEAAEDILRILVRQP